MTEGLLTDGELHVRTGCDIVAVREVTDSITRFGERYLRRVFTQAEIGDCAGANREERLAARFAAKEAVIKAMASPEAAFPLQEIEVVRNGPVPSLHLIGSVAKLAAAQGWIETALSLSHTDCHAAATVHVLCRRKGAQSSTVTIGCE